MSPSPPRPSLTAFSMGAGNGNIFDIWIRDQNSAGLGALDSQAGASYYSGNALAGGLHWSHGRGYPVLSDPPYHLNTPSAGPFIEPTTGENPTSATPCYSSSPLGLCPRGAPMKTPGLSPSGLGPGTPSSTLIVTPELTKFGGSLRSSPLATGISPLFDKNCRLTNSGSEGFPSAFSPTPQVPDKRYPFFQPPRQDPSPPPLFQAEGQGARVLDDLNLELNLPQFPSEGQETHGLNFNYLSPSYGAPYAGRHTTQAPSGAQYDDYFTSETLVGGPSPATDDPEFSPCDHVAVDAELATVPSTLNGAQRLTDSPWPVKQSQRGTDEHRNLTGMPPAFHALAAKHDTRLTGGAGGSGSGSLVPTGSFKATGASAAHWAAVEKRRKRDRRHQCDHCPDRFTSKQNLTNHKNSHFLLKPYKCEYCDKDYRHSRSLNRHLKKAHSIPTDRRRRRDG